MRAAVGGEAAPPPPWTRNAEMLVYVVPVGGTPPDAFAAYVRLLRAHRELPVASLTRPGAYAAELSPFRRFSWRGSGTLRFRFVATTERLENVDGEDALACHRPLGVLGICHCPATPDLRAAFEQFAQAARRLPPMLVRKCFAFEPRFDRSTADDCGALPDLVMFPARHDLHDGESTVSVHLRVVLDTLAVTILLSLESAVRGATQHQSADSAGPSSFLLDTTAEPSRASAQHASAAPPLAAQPLSSSSPATSTGAVPPLGDARSRKRHLARQRKLFGDYAVMVASVPDALEHYLAAIDLLREEERRSGGAPGDALWLAAALEGYAFCLYLEARGRFVVEIVDKASEAIALYARAGTTALESALIEKLGWYYVAVVAQLVTTPPAAAVGSAAAQGTQGTQGTDRATEVVWIKRLLWDALDRGLALFPELSPQRQVEFLVQGSRMLELLGHRRRMAFFLHDAASVLLDRSAAASVGAGGLLSPQSPPQRRKDLQAALLLEQVAAARLGIPSGDRVATAPKWEVSTLRHRPRDQRHRATAERGGGTSPDDSWLAIRFHVLRQLLTVAKFLGNELLIGRYSLQLLEVLSWCDSIAPAPPTARRAAVSADPSAEPAAVESLQRPAVASRVAGSLPDGAGLYAKGSVYFTPPPSLETKTRRYFSLAASPSSTMSSAAASLSSTIANTPRMLATPRQQLSAAVSAISTKASPAFVSFGHSHGFGAGGSSTTSTPASTSSGGGSFSMASPAGASDSLGQPRSSSRDSLSDRSASEAETSSAEPVANSGGARPSSVRQPPALLDLAAARSAWDLRSREAVVAIEKQLLGVLESECASLRPSEQAALPTFLRVDRLRVVHSAAAPLIRRSQALERHGSGAAAASAAGASDFFYSPFEKQQQERSKKKKVGSQVGEDDDGELDALYERAFPLRETIELQVVLSNPLGVAVDVQQLTAWVARDNEDRRSDDADEAAGSQGASQASVDADAVECYPCSLTLAPYEKGKAVALVVRPLLAGSFRVLGCFVRARNVRTAFALAAAARPRLRVVGELPLAALSLVEVGAMAESGADGARGQHGNHARVAMYSSETKRCELRVRNTGQRAIQSLRVAVAIRRRGRTRAAAVVFSNLTAGDGEGGGGGGGGEAVAAATAAAVVVETDRTVLTCDAAARLDALLPLASGEAVGVPYRMRLKQRASDLDEAAAAGDEDEQLEWSVVYGDAGTEPSALVREGRLAVETVALPSLAVASVQLVPSCATRPPATRPGGVRRTMDHSYCLAVIHVVNPTETVFRLRFRRRATPCEPLDALARRREVDVGRKSSRRVAVEVPRADALSLPPGGSLAAALNALLELEWQTYFGTRGHLVLRDSMWPERARGVELGLELARPPLAFDVAAGTDADADADVDVDADTDATPTRNDEAGAADLDSSFCFVDAPRLQRVARSSVRARLLAPVPIAVTVRRSAADADTAERARVGVRVSREGDDSDALGEHVLAVGRTETRVEWPRGAALARHEVQLAFLSEGEFLVAVYGQLERRGESAEVWSHRPVRVRVRASA